MGIRNFILKTTEELFVGILKYKNHIYDLAGNSKNQQLIESYISIKNRQITLDELQYNLSVKIANGKLKDDAFYRKINFGFFIGKGILGTVGCGVGLQTCARFLIDVKVLEISDFEGWTKYLISAPNNPLPILEIPRNLPSDSPETPILLIKDKEYTPWEQLVRFLGGMKVKEVPEDEPVVPVSKVEKVVIPKTSDNSITDID